MRSVFRLGMEDPAISGFVCNDKDLDDFFCNEWKAHHDQLLAATYAVVEDGVVIAMFSLANDRLESDKADRKTRNKLLRRIPYRKHRKYYPSVKLARLGVAKSHQGKMVGSWIIAFLKAYFVLNNKTGCRYLTVDAYPHRAKFYERNGFTRFGPVFPDPQAEYIHMEYDLKITKDLYDGDPARLRLAKAMINETLNVEGFAAVLATTENRIENGTPK